MAPYDQFIVFGDSITQQSCSQQHGFAFMPALQDAFIRRLDVINRGFSGYNTSQALVAFPKFMPKPEQAKVRFITIFFGANDACLPNSPTGQHVPLPEFAANLHKLIQMAREWAPEAGIILITPPPVNEYQLEAADMMKYNTPNPIPRRTAEHTRRYADMCNRVFKDTQVTNIALYNLWADMMEVAGWTLGTPLIGSRECEDNALLNYWLSDGLHLLPTGYQFLFDGFMGAIRLNWPDQDPANEPFVLPGWDEAPKA